MPPKKQPMTIKQRLIAYHQKQAEHFAETIEESRKLHTDTAEHAAEVVAMSAEFDAIVAEAPGEDAPENKQTLLGVVRDKLAFHRAAVEFLTQ